MSEGNKKISAQNDKIVINNSYTKPHFPIIKKIIRKL